MDNKHGMDIGKIREVPNVNQLQDPYKEKGVY